MPTLAKQHKPVKRRTQEERRTATRRALLDAAISVLLEEGYTNCSLAVVAKRAGLTHGALQHHFTSKSNLLKAVVEERLSNIDGLKDVPVDPTWSVEQRCQHMVDQTWKFYGNPNYLALWEIILGARSDPKLYGDIQTWQQRGIKSVETVLAALFQDFDLPKSKIRALQYFLNAHLRGLALLATVEINPRIVSTQKNMLVHALKNQLMEK